MSNFGTFLENLRANWKLWRIVMFAVLAAIVALNIFILPEHPHFVLDKYTGFWAGFGLVAGLAMVIGMKKIIQPMIAREEDFYDIDD